MVEADLGGRGLPGDAPRPEAFLLIDQIIGSELGTEAETIICAINNPYRTLLLTQLTSVGQSRSEISAKALKFHSKTSANITQDGTRQYLARLADEGLIDSEKNDHVYSHRLSPLSARNFPIFELALHYQGVESLPFLPVLGASQSSHEEQYKAPLTTMLMMLSVYGGCNTQAGVGTLVPISPKTLHSRLEVLNRFGLVNYDAVTPQSTEYQIEYELVNTSQVEVIDVASVRAQPVLTTQIVNACYALTDEGNAITADAVTELIAHNYEDRDPKMVREQVVRLLSALSGNVAGFLKRPGFQYKGGVKQSHIELTAKGITFVEDFILPVLRHVNQTSDISVERREALAEFRSNQSLFITETLELHYPYTLQAKKEHRYLDLENARRFVSQSGTRGITTDKLADELLVTEGRARRYLKELVRSTMAECTVTGGVFIFKSTGTTQMPQEIPSSP